MRNGIKTAVQAGFTHIQIEGDNKTLIQAVQGHFQCQWKIQVLMQDILAYIRLCNKIVIHHIFTEDNCATYWLTKFGHSLHSMAV